MSTAIGSRVRHWLSALSLEPSGMPCAAVLVVRRLGDPAPGRIAGDPEAPRGSAEWERAVQTTLTRCYREAARPEAGPVPPSAEAVLFLDRAELLACLARDLLFGAVSGRWWWQAWLRASGQSTIDLVLDAWVREASYAPAAVAALHERRLAVPFTESLSPRQARALFTALTEAYELPALAAPTPPADVPIVLVRGAPRPTARRARAPAPPNAREAGARPIADDVRPPWELFVPPSSVPPTLGLEQRTFLGVALALAGAPLAVRTRRFQQEFHLWRRAEQFRPPAAAPETSRARGPGDRATAAALSAEEAGTRGDVVERGDEARPALEQTAMPGAPAAPILQERHVEPPGWAGLPEVLLKSRSHEGGDVATPSAPRTERPTSSAKAARPTRRITGTPASPTVTPSATEPVIVGAVSGAGPIAPASPGMRVDPAHDLAESVRTSVAGVLFLINALQRLELFDRLDDHFGVASSVGGWAWLEIIGRSLLGRRRRDAMNDPIWPVLAALDGREPGAPVSGGLGRPRSYRLPESWPAPADADRMPGRRRRESPLGLKPTRRLGRLLDTLVPYLRWRLLKGMSLDHRPAREAESQMVSRLLYRRGRLSCTRTHVDLRMGMDQVDIAVRLAGLDANPGWIPALGRVVTFYYD